MLSKSMLPKSKKQKGATLIIALVMLLVVTMIGLSGLYSMTVQNKQIRALEEARLFYSEANILFGQALDKLNSTPDAQETFSATLPDTANAMSYQDNDICYGPGSDFRQLFRCRSVQSTVGFPDPQDSTQIEASSPTRSYTMHYQYRVFDTEY